MVNKINSSQYIEQRRKDYALYIMQNRAIPALSDGLKTATRRVLWTARDGKKWKSASLAGATMPIHPHASPESAIDTVTGPFCNNIPFFDGDGAFGTLIEPTEYGASRYTSVAVSQFTKDVIFADLDIVPLIDNYDNTLKEPLHFLPLVPIVLINPVEGMAIGFDTNILPRCLADIVATQINYLEGKADMPKLLPTFTPTNNICYKQEIRDRGIAYYFVGNIEKIGKNTIKIDKLPYGLTHKNLTDKLNNLATEGKIVDYIDKSRDKIHLEVKVTPDLYKNSDDESLIKLFGLEQRHYERLNVLDFDCESLRSLSPQQVIKLFTDWRLGWYVKRYERLRDLLKIDIQRYLDIQSAIKNNVGGLAKTIKSRNELKQQLQQFGIVYVDYIADLPVYRFTEEEYLKNEKKIQDAQKLLKEYEQLLSSDKKRVKVYVAELQSILNNYNKGLYS